MTLIEKACALHEPAGRETARDPDLVRWAEALPEAALLIEEVQFLRHEIENMAWGGPDDI